MKKRTPYNPAKPKQNVRGHLGIPTPEREAHSRSGFERDVLAGNRYVSRERAMLTHPALLADLYNAVIRQYEEKGEPLPERIHLSKITPSDRITAAHRNLLWAYLRVRIEVVKGTLRVADYEGMPSQQDLNRVPLNQNQFDARRFYAWLREQHGMMVVTDFLDRVALQISPELASDGERAPTKADIGRDLIGVENTRDAKAATDGALALACRILAESARDFAIIERRYRSELERLSRTRIA